MKTRAFLFVFLIQFTLYACTGKEDANSVKGLLNLDGNPVSIEIVDGKVVYQMNNFNFYGKEEAS